MTDFGLLLLETKGIGQEQAAKAAADAVESTYRETGMPLRLKDVGVTEQGIRQIAEDAMTDFGLHRNVRPVQDKEDLVELLQEIL